VLLLILIISTSFNAQALLKWESSSHCATRRDSTLARSRSICSISSLLAAKSPFFLSLEFPADLLLASAVQRMHLGLKRQTGGQTDRSHFGMGIGLLFLLVRLMVYWVTIVLNTRKLLLLLGRDTSVYWP
jgi:hypothetical protein